MFGAIASASIRLFLSMIMAMIMLVLLWFYQPDWFGWVQDGADLVEDSVAAIPLDDRYNNLVRIYASDDKIVLLIFTIIARIVIAIVESVVSRIFAPAIRVRSSNLIGRIGTMMSTLFLAFVLGILMLSVIALTMEGVLHSMLDAADWVETQLAHLPLAGRWRSGVRFIVSDDKILLLFFTLIARVVIAVIATSLSSSWRSMRGPKEPVIEVRG